MCEKSPNSFRMGPSCVVDEMFIEVPPYWETSPVWKNSWWHPWAAICLSHNNFGTTHPHYQNMSQMAFAKSWNGIQKSLLSSRKTQSQLKIYQWVSNQTFLLLYSVGLIFLIIYASIKTIIWYFFGNNLASFSSFFYSNKTKQSLITIH